MKTLTVLDLLSSYRDILTDDIFVPDHLRPKGNQTFTRVDVVKIHYGTGDRLLDYVELPQEANKESFLKFITLMEIIRDREGESVFIDRGALPLIKDTTGINGFEEIYYATHLFGVQLTAPTYPAGEGLIIPTLPSFLQESDLDEGDLAGMFDYGWDHLLRRYHQSYKVTRSIDGTKEREVIKLFSLKPKPLQWLSFVLPSNYGENDYQRVNTRFYSLDKF